MSLAPAPWSGGPIPPEGTITFRFELALLARHVERLPAADPQTLIPRILACLPADPEGALTCAQVGDRLPDASRRSVSSRVCELAREGQIKRVGPLGESRYYRPIP